MATDGTVAVEHRAPPPTAEASAPIPGRRVLGLGLALLLMAGAFWPSVSSFAVTWGRYDYAHGWLAPLLVAWLVWNDRGSFQRGLRRQRGGDPVLLVPVLGLSFFWFLSTVTHIQLFHQTAFVVLMVCWALYIFGRTSARTVLVSGLVVLLTMPVWELSLPVLRRVTTAVSGLLVTLLRIPAVIDGDFIHLPAGTFEIADGCAGLNYLLSALVIGLVYAETLVRGTRARLLVVGLAALVALLGNWVRVAALVVIGHVSTMQAELVKEHVGFGWVVFAIALVLFFILAARIDGDGSGSVARPLTGKAGDEDAGVEAAVEAGNGGGWARRLVGASGLAVVGPVAFWVIAALPPAEMDARGLSDLAAGAGWRTEASGSVPPWQPDYRGAQRHEQMRFTNGSREVYGDRFVYHEQTQNAKLIGWPNQIAPGRQIVDERVVGPVDPDGQLRVRQAIVRTTEGAVLAWYWYRVGGVDTFMPAHAKALEIPAFLARRRASELLALSAPCGPGDCRDAFETLAGLMGTRLATPVADSISAPAPPATHDIDRDPDAE